MGKSWAIPVDAERPVDGRITTGEYINWKKRMNDKVCHGRWVY